MPLSATEEEPCNLQKLAFDSVINKTAEYPATLPMREPDRDLTISLHKNGDNSLLGAFSNPVTRVAKKLR